MRIPDNSWTGSRHNIQRVDNEMKKVPCYATSAKVGDCSIEDVMFEMSSVVYLVECSMSQAGPPLLKMPERRRVFEKVCAGFASPRGREREPWPTTISVCPSRDRDSKPRT